MVPEGWTIQLLENLATIERGKFSARPRNDPKFFGGKMPFVQTGDITFSDIYLNRFSQTLNDEGVDVSRVFPPGTILITIAANIGDTAITTYEVACPDSVVAISVEKNRANSYWLKKLLETKKNELDRKATQNAQKNINLQVLKPLNILTPPLKEQEKIAQILSTWDKAITTTERLLANSQQQKKALMQQLLTGKKRLLDENGVRFSGKWDSIAVGELGKVVTGATPPKNDKNNYGDYLPWATADDFKQKYIKNTKVKLSEQGCKKARIVPPGSILVTCIASIGLNAIASESLATNQQINSIVVANGYSNEFIFYQLNKNQHKLMSLAGTTAVPIVNKSSFEKLALLIPDYSEQLKIASILVAQDEVIDKLKHKVDYLKNEKKALMQQLLTGKRRVKVDEDAA